MFELVARVYAWVALCWPARESASSDGDDRGQTTAEYALVLLGAAGVALMLVAWAAHSGKIGSLLDHVLDRIVRDVK